MTPALRRHHLHDGQFLIVDDHALLREGVVSVVRHLAGSAPITQAENLREACECLQHMAPGPLTVILDLQLPDSSGLATLQAIRASTPRARIAIVSAHNDLDLALACIQEGACAFVPKQGSVVEFQQALSVIASGGVYFPRELFVSVGLPTTPAPALDTQGLTPRQHEVRALLLDGLSNAAIADHLAISEETVKLHVRAILRAHGVSNRVQLVLSQARLTA